MQENEEGKNISHNIMETLRNEFHGFDYSGFFGDDDKKRYNLIRAGAELVHSTENKKKNFMYQTKKRKDIYKICVSLLAKRTREEVAYFLAIRSFIMKQSGTGVPDLK